LAAPLLHAVTAGVLGILGHVLGGPVLGFWSAVAYATLPGVALSAVLITTDVPLLCCWAVALLAFVRLRDGAGWPWAVLCGLALGAGLLSKYIMLLFVPCAALCLVRSGRRIAPARLALAAGIAALMVAPNVAWNLSNHLGTVRHSASRLSPGVSSFRLDEPLLFLLGQFALVGPNLGVALVIGLFAPAGRRDDRRLLLGTFTVLPLAVALLVSIVARANLNWAAPAYVAGCVLAVAWALGAGRQRPLARAVALNAALGFALYGALAAVPAMRWRGQPVPVAARFHGWAELGRRVAARAAALGDARVLADLRELLPVAAYYGRVPESRLVEWNPSGVPHSHFQARARLEAGDPGPWLFVSYRPQPTGVTKRFARAELVEVVTVPLAPGLSRTHWLFALSGFRGYARETRAAAAPASR
jgi:4-amino-4-deoxy-L-arabinose transferase-like glycosyltransferase